jgi:hypothetical protein
MQALLGSYVWDWEELRGELPALAAAWLPGDPGDLIGSGVAIDETAQLDGRVKGACGAARGRCAPLDPPARSQNPAAIRGTGSRISHPQTRVIMTAETPNRTLAVTGRCR